MPKIYIEDYNSYVCEISNEGLKKLESGEESIENVFDYFRAWDGLEWKNGNTTYEVIER